MINQPTTSNHWQIEEHGSCGARLYSTTELQTEIDSNRLFPHCIVRNQDGMRIAARFVEGISFPTQNSELSSVPGPNAIAPREPGTTTKFSLIEEYGTQVKQAIFTTDCLAASSVSRLSFYWRWCLIPVGLQLVGAISIALVVLSTVVEIAGILIIPCAFVSIFLFGLLLCGMFNIPRELELYRMLTVEIERDPASVCGRIRSKLRKLGLLERGIPERYLLLKGLEVCYSKLGVCADIRFVRREISRLKREYRWARWKERDSFKQIRDAELAWCDRRYTTLINALPVG